MPRSHLLTALLLAALGLGACTPPVTPIAISRGGPELDDASAKPSEPGHFLPWAAEAPWFIIVDKPTRKLELYHFGERAKVYDVVLGRNSGRKLYEGDRRTPAGVYTITKKRDHARFHRFMDIDYPNPVDLAAYQESARYDLIPKNASPGALVGIHGSEDEQLTKVGVNWTYGCIALMNADIEELYTTVPEGTPVLIRDAQSP